MESFFERLNAGRWAAGVDQYHFHVLPDPETVRAQLTAPYRELTAMPGLEAVAPEWAHITVQRLAEVRDAGVMDLITDRVRQACAPLEPFEVQVRRPEVWREAVVCPVAPGQGLRRLFTLTRQAAAAAGTQPEQACYYPHLTLACCGQHRDDGPLREWLSDHAFPEPVIPVEQLILVRQRHDGRRITWTTLDEIPLSPHRACGCPVTREEP